MTLSERISSARRRKRFQEHAAFRTGPDGSTVILDTDLESRLKALGPFTSEAIMGGRREITWKSPDGLTCDFAPFKLIFTIDPDNVGPDQAAFEPWGRSRSQHEVHMEDFKVRLIELHRGVEDALACLRCVGIEVCQKGYGETATHELTASCQLEWDEEHTYRLAFDPQTGTFGDWED